MMQLFEVAAMFAVFQLKLKPWQLQLFAQPYNGDPRGPVPPVTVSNRKQAASHSSRDLQCKLIKLCRLLQSPKISPAMILIMSISQQTCTQFKWQSFQFQCCAGLCAGVLSIAILFCQPLEIYVVCLLPNQALTEWWGCATMQFPSRRISPIQQTPHFQPACSKAV